MKVLCVLFDFCWWLRMVGHDTIINM